MAQRQIKKLVSYDATTKQKAFVIQDNNKTETYFGNIEKYDTVFDKQFDANRYCLSSETYGLVHNIYNSSRILFHGLAARRHRYQYAKIDDYQHIYRAIADETLSASLNNGLCSIVKVQDTLYGIDHPGTYGHYYVNDDMYSWLAQDNGYPLPKPLKYSTLLYNKQNLDQATTPKIIDSTISGIMYNTLFEIPGNLYTDYSSGSMFATTVKCKNQLNSVYSMQHDNTYILRNTRCYEGIYGCNNQVYLKFSDIGSYTSNPNNDEDIIVNVDGENHTITHKFATKSNNVNPTTKVQQIEYIENINRGATPSNHKSSLYSLRLQAPDLEQIGTNFNNEDGAKMRENIRQEIKNIIRSLAERIAPANTQLFAVTVNSK